MTKRRFRLLLVLAIVFAAFCSLWLYRAVSDSIALADIRPSGTAPWMGDFNHRLDRESGWKKHRFTAAESGFPHEVVDGIFRGLCTEADPQVIWTVAGDPLTVTSVTYPARLEPAIQATLRSLRARRDSGAGNSEGR